MKKRLFCIDNVNFLWHDGNNEGAETPKKRKEQKNGIGPESDEEGTVFSPAFQG